MAAERFPARERFPPCGSEGRQAAPSASVDRGEVRQCGLPETLDPLFDALSRKSVPVEERRLLRRRGAGLVTDERGRPFGGAFHPLPPRRVVCRVVGKQPGIQRPASFAGASRIPVERAGRAPSRISSPARTSMRARSGAHVRLCPPRRSLTARSSVRPSRIFAREHPPRRLERELDQPEPPASGSTRWCGFRS